MGQVLVLRDSVWPAQKGDQDSDGDLDSADVTAIQGWFPSPYDVRADLDLDGGVTASDATLASNASPITLGWGNLSDRGNRKGYGGYELDPVLSYTTWHVRRRVLISDLGRWLTRDPIGYVGGMNLYQYGSSNPLGNIDPFGLLPPPGGGGPLPGGGRRPVPETIFPPGYGFELQFVPCATSRPIPDPIAPPRSGLGFLLFGAVDRAPSCPSRKLHPWDPVWFQNPAHLPVVTRHQSEVAASGSVALGRSRR